MVHLAAIGLGERRLVETAKIGEDPRPANTSEQKQRPQHAI